MYCSSSSGARESGGGGAVYSGTDVTEINKTKATLSDDDVRSFSIAQ
jgi:hypothetical protein